MNVADMVRVHAHRRPDHQALVDGGRALDWRGLWQQATLAAARLARRGVGPGDVVALLLREPIETVILMLAAAQCGAAWLVLDWRMRPAERASLLGTIVPRLVIGDGRGTAGERWPQDLAVPFTKPGDAAGPMAASPAEGEAMAAVVVSSGTTGLPKAVALSHRALAWRGVIVTADDGLLPETRILHALPLSASAAHSHLMAQLFTGACGIFVPAIFSAEEIAVQIDRLEVDHVAVVPTILRAMLGVAPGPGLLLPRLRTLVSLGATLHAEEKAAFMARLTPHIVERYGAVGAGPICMARSGQLARNPATVGYPSLTVRVEAVDERGWSVLPGTAGQIRVRSAGQASGFIGPATSGGEQFRDGWFYPGDLGSISSDGLVTLVGRAGSVINRGGLKISPEEIEQVLLAHPAVAETAVIGRPDPQLGEVPVALVVCRATATAAVELEAHCRARLQPPKVPVTFRFVDALPRTAAGKIDRGALPALVGIVAAEPRPPG